MGGLLRSGAEKAGPNRRVRCGLQPGVLGDRDLSSTAGFVKKGITMGMFFRRIVTLTAGVGLVVGAGIAAAGPASAEEGDASCKSGEVCFFWGKNFTGCVSTFYDDNRDHGYYRFGTGCTGKGEALEDNAASAKNKASVSNVYIWEDDNYGGTSIMIQNGAEKANLGALRNHNSSHYFSIW
ncbi:MAG: hypothetical protein GXX79_12950 [Actinomycetales bacterium]|nr:hypothetical protein [Actinomycetales bacterium]